MEKSVLEDWGQNFNEIIISKKEYKIPKPKITTLISLDFLDKENLLPEESFDQPN